MATLTIPRRAAIELVTAQMLRLFVPQDRQAALAGRIREAVASAIDAVEARGVPVHHMREFFRSVLDVTIPVVLDMSAATSDDRDDAAPQQIH